MQLKENQKELLKNVDILQDLEQRSHEHRKMEEEMKKHNIKYKLRLQEQSKKLEKIEDAVRLNVDNLTGEINGIRQENALMSDLNVGRKRKFNLSNQVRILKYR